MRRVAITAAEQEAEQALVRDIKAAEAARKAAELKAEQDRFTEVRAADSAKPRTCRRNSALAWRRPVETRTSEGDWLGDLDSNQG